MCIGKSIKRFMAVALGMTMMVGMLTACSGGTNGVESGKDIYSYDRQISIGATNKIKDYFGIEVDKDEYDSLVSSIIQQRQQSSKGDLSSNEEILGHLLTADELHNSFMTNYIFMKLGELVSDEYTVSEEDIQKNLTDMKAGLENSGITDKEAQKKSVEDYMKYQSQQEISNLLYTAAVNEYIIDQLKAKNVDTSKYTYRTIKDTQEALLPKWEKGKHKAEKSTDKEVTTDTNADKTTDKEQKDNNEQK